MTSSAGWSLLSPGDKPETPAAAQPSAEPPPLPNSAKALPRLPSKPSRPRARLTPAERESALLAAAGHSNKEIADQLMLSVRTVESRLQHVYEKLGVPGRDQLSETLSKSDRGHPDT